MDLYTTVQNSHQLTNTALKSKYYILLNSKKMIKNHRRQTFKLLIHFGDHISFAGMPVNPWHANLFHLPCLTLIGH